jgi:hypothetical protein
MYACSVPDSKRDEHARLRQRTAHLEKEHQALGLDRKPFNKADHDQHARNLATHKAALQRHRKRVPDPEVT